MPVSLTAPLAPGGLAHSRRGFIVGGVGLATAIGLTAGGARSTETRHLAGDLFAFTAPDRPEVVFAVTLPRTAIRPNRARRVNRPIARWREHLDDRPLRAHTNGRFVI